MDHMQLPSLTLYFIIREAHQLQAPSLHMTEKFSWKQKTHLYCKQQNLENKGMGARI